MEFYKWVLQDSHGEHTIGTPRPIRQVGWTPRMYQVDEYIRNADILLGESKYAKNEVYGMTSRHVTYNQTV